MKLKKIGYRVDDDMLAKMQRLAAKERWSLARLTEVAVEYYLKVRGLK